VTWLLDTNVISEVVRPRPNEGVLAWLAERAGDETRLFVSALTLAEIYRGAMRLDPAHRRFARLRAWADRELPTRFGGRILAFDEHVARSWGAITAVLPKGVNVANMDSLIAATAVHHHLVLVTRNVADMRHFSDLAIENPWR
jgi:predicted nucleic acid-binding protein